MIGLGLLVDLVTSRELVVAIVFDIPIALSALSTSRRLPIWITGAALVANAAAGYGNAIDNGLDGIAVINRGLAALSFVLLGILTIALRRTVASETKLRIQAGRSQQEVQLREMLARLSENMSPESFLTVAAEELRQLLEADSVVIVAHDRHRFIAPRATAPASTEFASVGEAVPWAVTTVGEKSSSVAAARLLSGLLLVGRWQPKEQGNLVVLVRRPHHAEGKSLLSAALRFLHPLYERSCLIETAVMTTT